MLDNDVNNDENSDHSIWKLQSSFTRKKSDKKSKTSKPTTSVNVKETIDDNSLEEQNIITCNFDEISAISGLYVDEIPPNTIYNKESLKTTRVKGHCFTKKNFRKPLICHHCAETLWGLLGTTGYICQICNYLTHEKCISQIIIPCNSILPCIITEPAPHCWSEISHYKRKFCNVCRKRLEDVQGYKCEICEYYVHTECFDFAISNCKQCAIASWDSAAKDASHLFREGNLPINSKCFVCKKICSSVECLTGLRCEWCGFTIHLTCHKKTPKECTHGPFRDIILLPAAVSLPNALMEQIYEIKRPKQEDLVGSSQGVVDDFSESDSGRDDAGFERKSIKEKKDKEHYEFVRIFDGLERLNKRQCRYLSINKNTPVYKVVEMAVKAFQLPIYEFEKCCLFEVNDKDGSERKLESNELFKKTLTFDMRRPQVMLKLEDRNLDREYISIYPGDVVKSAPISIKPIRISITKDTDTQTALLMSLRKFGQEHLNSQQFNLVETCLDCGTTERIIKKDENLWTLLSNLKSQSVRRFYLTRYYIRKACDPYGSNGVALYVGNLKKGLSQRLYERILLEHLTPSNKWDAIESIYYDSGGIILLYSNAERAETAFNILKDANFDDVPIKPILLPRIEPSVIPSDVHPLLVFVNVKSGGCQGIELISAFRKLLNPHQVFNLDHGGPLPGLHCFRGLDSFRVLVCGGDGTVGWVLSCLDTVGQDARCPHPPIAVIPLGTGNDLARVLRWGSGYTGAEDPVMLLKDVVEAEEIRLDRWTVMIKPNEMEKDDQKRALQLLANAANTNEETTRIFLMNNYFGLGIDADLNLDFHNAREENPGKFTSRIHNKGIYFKMGLRKMVNRTKCKDLHQKVSLEVDGRQIELPPLEGIIILNIMSWGAGANPWGWSEDSISGGGGGGGGVSGSGGSNQYGNQSGGGGAKESSSGSSSGSGGFSRPTHYDGLLEVVGVTGVVHMGQIFSGLRTGTRLAQGGHIRITLKTPVPLQVDGEPWIQSPCQITVLRSALKATMLKKRKRRKVNRRNTEPGIPPPVASPPPLPLASGSGHITNETSIGRMAPRSQMSTGAVTNASVAAMAASVGASTDWDDCTTTVKSGSGSNLCHSPIIDDAEEEIGDDDIEEEDEEDESPILPVEPALDDLELDIDLNDGKNNNAI